MANDIIFQDIEDNIFEQINELMTKMKYYHQKKTQKV